MFLLMSATNLANNYSLLTSFVLYTKKAGLKPERLFLLFLQIMGLISFKFLVGILSCGEVIWSDQMLASGFKRVISSSQTGISTHYLAFIETPVNLLTHSHLNRKPGWKMANFPDLAVYGRLDQPQYFVLSCPCQSKTFLSSVLKWQLWK